MKKILLLTFFVTSSAFAVFPKINAKGVSGDYVDSQGQAYAEYVEYELPEVKLIHREIDVNFNKPEKFLEISDKNSSVSIKFDFSFMNVFKTFSFKNLTLLSDEDFFELALDRLYVMLEPNDFTLKKVVLAADVKEQNAKTEMSFLEGFLFKGMAQIEALYLGDYSFETIIQDIAEENFIKSKSLMPYFQKEMKAIPMTGRHISLETKEGRFHGQALLDSWVNLWLRFNGNISLSQDSRELIIDLQSARLGLFSIRSTVLKRLRKIQNDKIKVEGSRITVLIGQASKQ